MDWITGDNNSSISSSSSNGSHSFDVNQKTSSKSMLSKMSSKLKLEKKREKRWKKNKIDKEDFFNKTTEFRTWLEEKKNIQFDTLTTPKAKTIFKRFVKKWNGKKLEEKYYSGLGVYWATASPGAYSHCTMPLLDEKSRQPLKATQFTPLYETKFSTFGKMQGKNLLNELQLAEDDGTQSLQEESVYSVPAEEEVSGLARKRVHSVRVRPALSQLYAPESMPAPDASNGHSSSELMSWPHTDYLSTMRRQSQSMTSTGSTESTSSSISSSASTHCSRHSRGPKPPPRTSSNSIHQVAAIVDHALAMSEAAAPVGEAAPCPTNRRECAVDDRSPPTSRPLASISDELNTYCDFTPPPPESAAPAIGAASPGPLSPDIALPLPPLPLEAVRGRLSSARRRQSMLLAQSVMHTASKPRATSAVTPSVPMGSEGKGQGPLKPRLIFSAERNQAPMLDARGMCCQENALLHTTQKPASLTRRRMMTPHHIPHGPVHVSEQVAAFSATATATTATTTRAARKSPKRRSDSSLRSSLAITPAKTINLDISYQTTCI